MASNTSIVTQPYASKEPKGGEATATTSGSPQQATAAEMEKKMRLLDLNQRAYSEDTNTVMRKQAEAIQSLTKENESLRQEIQNNNKFRSVSHNIKHANTVSTLGDSADALDRRVAAQRAMCQDLDDQIREAKRRTLAARRTLGGVNISKDHSHMIDNQVQVLENRLDQALVKFNEALSYNKDLRRQIDNLRRERIVFDGIYKKLERELHEKKKQMADIIEQSNLFYEERDTAVHELNTLKVAAEKDMLQYDEHFRELDIMIEADKNLKESIKNSQRARQTPTVKKAMVHGDSSDALTGGGQQQDSKLSGDDKAASKQPLVDASNKAAAAATTSSGSAQQQSKAVAEVEDAEEAISALQEGTGIFDIKVLVEHFVNAEEQNFSLYNFVNDLNKEAEFLSEHSIAELKSEFDKYHGSGMDGQRTKVLRDLEEKLAITERTSEDYEEKAAKCEESITEMRIAIESLFNKVGCALDEMSDLLGNNQCTENTMLTFLGIMEQRATELLSMYNYNVLHGKREAGPESSGEDTGDESVAAQTMGMGSARLLGATGPAVPFGSASVNLAISQLPTTGETFANEGFDDTEDDKVLTQEELRAQTEYRLASKEDGKGGVGFGGGTDYSAHKGGGGGGTKASSKGLKLGRTK